MTYSLDLKVRMVNYYKNSGSSLRSIEDDFDLSKSSLHRWVNDKHMNITVDRSNTKRVNIDALNFLKRSLDQNPFQNLNMLRTKLANKLSFYCTIKTVSNYLRIVGYSKKRIVRRLYNKSLKAHLTTRKQMKHKLKRLNKDDIICIDESGINGDIYSKYGWCKLSKRLIRNIPINRLPKKHSLIMAISNKKVIKYELHNNKAINTDLYYSFLSDLLKDIHNKYILMDNIAFHKSKRILELIKKSNNEVLFIPPYSPDFNPIEEVFSKMKMYIRRYINPVTINRDIKILLKKFVNTSGSFECYYKHAFD